MLRMAIDSRAQGRVRDLSHQVGNPLALPVPHVSFKRALPSSSAEKLIVEDLAQVKRRRKTLQGAFGSNVTQSSLPVLSSISFQHLRFSLASSESTRKETTATTKVRESCESVG